MLSRTTRNAFAIATIVSMAGQAATAVEATDVLRTGIEAQTVTDIDRLSDQIIDKELDLLRLDIRFRLNQIQKPWMNRVWFTANLSNVALTATGAFLNGCGRFSYLHKNRIKRAPKDLFEHATVLRVIANAEIVGGAAILSSVLAWKEHKDKQRELDLPTLHRYALRETKEIDELIAKRNAAVAGVSMTDQERQMTVQEGVVLADLRQVVVNRFARYYADGQTNRFMNYLSYGIAGVSNAVSMSGGLVGLYASQQRRATARYKTRLGGTGGITDIISGSINSSVPFVLRYAARRTFAAKYPIICSELNCPEQPPVDKLHSDVKVYDDISAKPELAVHGVVLKDQLFQRTATFIDEHDRIRVAGAKGAEQRFHNQLRFFGSIGPAKLANGIGSTVAAFKYTANAHERFEAIGGPAIYYGVGYCLGAAELIRYQSFLELSAARAKREGRAPGQVLQRELNELDQIATARKART